MRWTREGVVYVCNIFDTGKAVSVFGKCGGQIERHLRLHRKLCYHERFIENVATNGA